MVSLRRKAEFVEAGEERSTFGSKVNNSQVEMKFLLKKGDDSNVTDSDSQEGGIFLDDFSGF